MANYDIPDYPLKRLRYFNNQFLIDQDFVDSEAVQIGHERAILRSLCVAGVCEGLVVTYPATNKPPSVGPGIAVDGKGRMIVVAGATDAPVKPDALADGDYFVHISFLETEDDKATGQGAPDFTRWKQTPVINATAKSAALPDGAIVLGSCTVQNKVFVGTGTTAGRQYSGLRLPGLNKTVTATLRNTGAADDLAVLGGSLTIRRDAAGKIGPTLTLLNGQGPPGAGAAGAGGAIDFDGYDPGSNAPALRVQSLDDGNYSSHLAFATKQPGAAANGLVERLRLTSDGVLRFSNVVPKDKLVIWETSATDRYGLGLNGGNINLFYPTTAHFSLRQNSSAGTEVFSVSGTGVATFFGPIVPKVGNDASSGIQFPANPGGGGGDEAFLRYAVVSGETTQLVLGINNDADDALVLWQAGAARVTIANNLTAVATTLAVNGDLQLTGKTALRGNDSWLRLNQDAQFTSGVYTPGVLRVDGDIQLVGKTAFRGNDTWLRLNQDAQFSAGVYTPGVLRVDGDVQLVGKTALRGNDTWLRLNQDGQFGSGVYTPGLLRVDGDIQVGHRLSISGAATFGISNWNSYAADSTIVTDNASYKAMMIVGSNQNQGHARWVRMWDDVQVEQHLTVNGKIGAAGWSPTGGGNFPAGWGGGVHTWDIVVEASVGYTNLVKWSSIHEKTEVREVPDALATLDQLNPAVYQRGGKPQVGFVAEEVREVFAHGAEAHGEEFFAVGIQPDALLALTVAAVQELSARVRELSANGRGEPPPGEPVAASNHAAASAARSATPPRIEILREGNKDAHHYVTARFRTDRKAGDPCQVVRTIRIPDSASRDEYLEAEYAAWRGRVAG